MEKTFAKVESLADNIKEYINTRIDTAKLTAAEKTSSIVAHAVVVIIISIFLLFFLVLASIALALLISVWTGKPWLAFLIVAALYLVGALVVWLAREKWIRLPVMNAFILQLFRNDEED